MVMTARAIFLLVVVLYRSVGAAVGLTLDPTASLLDGELSFERTDVEAVSADFGRTTRSEPAAVFHPASTSGIAALVRSSYTSPASPFPVSARGHGHSTGGQAGAASGVVVQMSGGGGGGRRHGMSPPVYSPSLGRHYVDVWGGELWADVLSWTLEHGRLAPKSWTDYLHLSVGGTLSNAGISGQAFRHGPQISNVLELDVVTGRGDVVRCSEEENRELFHAVLGGLGQFGIITRARIELERAPTRVRWIRVLYSNFTAFTGDQERLIAMQGEQRRGFDYLEGFVIVDEGLVNNWRSSFFSPGNPVRVSSVAPSGTVLYCLEVTKNYDEGTAHTVDEEVDALLGELYFLPGTVFATDLPYVDFLDRVHTAEAKLRSKGLWDVPHPWLNLFVPASRMGDFDRGVLRGIILGEDGKRKKRKKTSGPILIYPMNRNKWDDRSSAVLPEEDVFYLVGFLRSAVGDGSAADGSQSLRSLTRQNERILRFCREAGIGAKQYLPQHPGREQWEEHFGEAWGRFLKRKAEFDPKGILGTGQGIFRPATAPAAAASAALPS